MTKRILGLIAAVPLILLLLILGSMASETGSRWLLDGLFSLLPAEVKVNNTEGRLLDRIILNGLSYQGITEQVHINKLELSWQPSQLLTGTLKIKQLAASGIEITLRPSAKPDQSKSNLADGLKLPVEPDIDNLLLTGITVIKDDSRYEFRKLQLSAQTEDGRIFISSLQLDSDLISANAKGSISTTRGLPLELNVDWQTNLDNNGIWQGNTKLEGNLSALNIDNRLSSPFKFTLQGDVQDVAVHPRINLRGKWEKLAWPFATASPQIQSPKGDIQVNGPLTHYQLKINGQLTQQYLPEANLSFAGAGSMDAIKIDKLDITSESGLFHLDCTAGWKDVPVFDFNVKGTDFNPAILIPELPGSLDIITRIKGRIDPKGMQLTADLNRIAGQLRQQPFEAAGAFELDGERLEVNGLQIEWGINKLAVNGNLDRNRGDLIFDANLPRLDSLWPAFAGKLEGVGRIQGGWSNPAVSLQFAGKALQFAQNRAEELVLTADYDPGRINKPSTVNLSLKEISANGIHLDRVVLDGKGSLQKHEFKLALKSSPADLTASLSGNWTMPIWQAELSKFIITGQNSNPWSLTKPAPIRIENKPGGIEAALDEICLAWQTSSLCTKIAKYANSDLDFKLTASSLPSALIQPWLPEETTLITSLDGKINLERKKNHLTGEYRFSTGPTQLAIKKKEFHLRSSSLTGTVNGDVISSSLDLNLTANDYVNSRLMFYTGKTQAVSGKINASVTDFSPVQAFTPQISNLQGKLNADLALSGPINKPKLDGYFELAKGAVESGQFGLRNVKFSGNFDSGQDNRIRLSGSAVPLILNNPSSAQTLSLQGLINFSADIRQTPGLAGEFMLALPSATLSVLRNGFNHEVNFARSTLKGELLNNTLNADLELALPRNDYLQGNLNMNLGGTNAFSAQMNAAVRDFKLAEAFVPDLTNIKGALIADLSASGTFQDPRINGKLDFSGGADIERLGIALRQVNLHAGTPALTEHIVQLRGSAQSGEGKLNLDGIIDLNAEPQRQMNLFLKGNDFEVAKMAEAEVAVSPDLKIAATDKRTSITGALAVPKAIIRIQDIPENAVKVSPDEIILGEKTPETRQITAPDLYADILVTLGKNVSFTGQGLKTGLNGQLRITKESEKLAMQGSVNMANATYKSYGQDLTVRKGEFVFNGPVNNPWLNVEAIRVSKDKKVTAVLNLNGPLENPRTHVSSEPSLSESEALAYLITGNPLNQVSKAEGSVLASAALSYGADQAAWIAEKLGFSDFSVQQGGNLKDTLLVMGKYLTPDFYLGARVGMFNKQAVMVLKHNLIGNLNVETQAGTSQRIKLNYEFDGN